jgi:hypothetical protein
MKRSMNAGQREAQWREHIAAHAKSGHSIAAWCREQGIAVQTFYWWRARLGSARRNKPAQRAHQAPPFIDLGTLAQAEQTHGLDIRLDLGNGMVLTIARR